MLGEDDPARADPPTLNELFANVRANYFRLYLNFMYFNVGRYVYLQTDVMFPYILLTPTLVAGTITLGIMQQILSAFSEVRTLVPVSRHVLEHHRRADLDLSAPARLRGQDLRRGTAIDRGTAGIRGVSLVVDGALYRPVFTLVQSRLMMRWVAGSRAVITNSFESVASSG